MFHSVTAQMLWEVPNSNCPTTVRRFLSALPNVSDCDYRIGCESLKRAIASDGMRSEGPPLGTNLSGELETFSLIATADPDPKGFAWVATLVGLFETGYVADRANSPPILPVGRDRYSASSQYRPTTCLQKPANRSRRAVSFPRRRRPARRRPDR